MGTRLDKNSTNVRKRIEAHTFTGEDGDEYEPSAFGGFPEYFRRKKIKLQNLDAELRASSSSQDKPNIFKGVVAHVSGYTQPPLHVLHKELVLHGAAFIQYLDSKTMATHIIASSLTPKKAVEFARYRIVKPAWVMDSIAAGKALPWNDYKVVDEGTRQKVIKFAGDGKLSSQANVRQGGYSEQIRDSYYASQFKSTAGGGKRPLQGISGGQSSAQTMATGAENIEDIDDEVLDDVDEDELMAMVEAEAIVAQRPRDRGLHKMKIKAIKPKMAKEADPPDRRTGLDKQRSDIGENVAPLQSSEMDQVENNVQKQETATTSNNIQKPDVLLKQGPPFKPIEQMTPEEHNEWLLSDPRMRKSSTANPDFIKQYYSESRLHHLSAWKAELKSRMQKLALEKTGIAKPVKRRPGSRRYVMHVDFDSFFCAVSLKSKPEWVDKPVVVAHGAGTGSEIASCNYPARKFGVKNGMWMKLALEKCPELKQLPYDFPAYEQTSKLFYEAILEVGGIVQSVSIDEALLDITALVMTATGSDGHGVEEGSIWREQAKADEMAQTLRDKIKGSTGCNVSIGIGGNILLAKVALRRAKPAGQYQIKPDDILNILGELKVENLPGVAYSISGKLEEVGVKLVKDILEVSKERLIGVLGPKTGEKLWEYSRGIDRVEVGDQVIRKSVSAEVNWGIRFISQPEAEEFIMNLCKELERRLVNENVKGKHLTMKIMRRSQDSPLDPAKHLGHGKCDTFNRSTVFGVATHNADSIGKEAITILRSFKFSPGDLRGLGVQLQKLEQIKTAAILDSSQKKLTFGAPAPGRTSSVDDVDDSKSTAKTTTSPKSATDPIAEDPLTPRKPKHTHPALHLAKANAIDGKANSPMNMMGTQFIMPSQVDPAVLDELPPSIRDRLKAQLKTAKTTGGSSREASPSIEADVKSREGSPALASEIPPEIDPEVFAALPDDMKLEILATYGGNRRGQSVLPQSPRKERVLTKAVPKPSPSKRGGLRGLISRKKERQHDANSGLFQTNFLTGGIKTAAPSKASASASVSAAAAAAVATDDDMSGHDSEGVDDLDPEFLAELPEEVRREVIADHRRRKLAQKSGLNINVPSNRRAGRAGGPAGIIDGITGPTMISFPNLPVKVPFGPATSTSSSLESSVRELKDMLSAWHRETKEEGPHHADVEVLEKYLARVVVEERDMNKVGQLVRWLDWLVSGALDETVPGTRSWQDALCGVRKAVQEAVRARGLGRMVF